MPGSSPMSKSGRCRHRGCASAAAIRWVAHPARIALATVAGEHVLIVRDSSGALGAFANRCMHRGTELVDSTTPVAAAVLRVRDPLSVSLLGVRIRWVVARLSMGRRHRSRSSSASDASRCRSGEGSSSCDSQTVIGSSSTNSAPIAARVERYPLDQLVVGRRITYDVAANWKVIAENYNECYHCGPVHPELCDLVPAFRVRGGADARLDCRHSSPRRRRHLHRQWHQRAGLVPRSQRGRADQSLRRVDLSQLDVVVVPRSRRCVRPAADCCRPHA